MSLINNDELKRNVHDYIQEIKKKNLVTCDKYLEFTQLRRYSGPSHGDVIVIPLIILNTPSSGLSILIIVKDTVHVGPFFNSPLPMFKC